MKGHYRPFKYEDIEPIASQMCEADATEVMLSDGQTPLEALTKSCEMSAEAFTIVSPEKELLGMFGLSYIDDHVGSPWMLTTGKLSNYSMQFLREGRRWVTTSSKHLSLIHI